MSSVTEPGVYYGYAQVSREKDGRVALSEEEGKVLPMVMSLGWNPFYKNERMSAVCLLLSLILCHSDKFRRRFISCTASATTSTGTT